MFVPIEPATFLTLAFSAYACGPGRSTSAPVLSTSAMFRSTVTEYTSTEVALTITTASSHPSQSYNKRGLAYRDYSLCSSFNREVFKFSYNWDQTGEECAGAEFVPMMHKPSASTVEMWLTNVEKAYRAGTRVVMGFNEPDLATQADLSPEQACANWTAYMQPLNNIYSDITILGPAVTNGAAPEGLDWLDRFNTACRGATWHASNIHFYDDPEGKACASTIRRFISHVEQAFSDFGKPVWVTEFGLNPGASAQEAVDFLKGVMEFMEGSDKVEGFSYFMVGNDQSRNMLNSHSDLSNTGEIYNS